MDRLLGLNLKLTRASNQIDALFEDIDAFLGDEPYSVEKYFDAKAAEYIYRGRILKEPRPEWSIAISECLHLYNSALDNMAWLVASQDGSKPPTGTGFPVFPSKPSYRKLWSRQGGYYMVRAMPPHAQAIIENAQPYHRGKAYAGHPLWVLRRLANIDKHQALHLVASSTPQIETEVLMAEGVKLPTFNRRTGPFKDGAVLLSFPPPHILPGQSPADAKMNMNIRVAFGVALPKDGPGNGRDVRRVLEDIQNAVETICRELLPFVNELEPEVPIEPSSTEIRMTD